MNELIKMLIEQLCILSKDELIWPTTMLVGWLNFVKNQLADQRTTFLLTRFLLPHSPPYY